MSRSEANLRSTRVAEDRCREVERRKAEMEEERHSLDAELRRLRGEIEQRESKTAASFWQRTVAADREKTRLENALDQAEAKVSRFGVFCFDGIKGEQARVRGWLLGGCQDLVWLTWLWVAFGARRSPTNVA